MKSFILSALIALPVMAQAQTLSLPPAVTAVIDLAREDCAAFDDGTLEVPADAVQQLDLTGDGSADDWIFDHQKVQCSSAASLYCGTGGCSLDLIVADTVTRKLSKGWAITDFGVIHTVLLQVHGANCGGTNLNQCVEALVWDEAEQSFFSLAPPSE